MAPNAADQLASGRQSLEFSAMKSAKASNSWGATFPEQFDSQDDSSKFMERCLLLAMSQLLYSRNLLPPTSFRKRVVTEIVRCQVPDTNDRIGRRLLEKLRGAGEALRHGYLNEFIVVVSTNDNNHDEAVEVFTWTVQYNDDNSSCMFLINDRGDALAKIEYKGPEHVKEQTRLLLLRIRKLCKDILAPLPQNAFPTFRATYTMATPKGYQAPGFYRSPTLYALHNDARSLDVGGIGTGKHKVLLSVDSIFIDDARSAVAIFNEDVASDISSMQSDSSFLEDAFNSNNFADLEEQRFEPVEESPPMAVEKVEEKQELRRGSRPGRKAPKVSAERESPALRSQRKTKKPIEPLEDPTEPAPKKSPGFSGKMTENTPTSSPPRNH